MAEPVVDADDQWALTPDDHALVMSKHRANRLGFAILLAFFRDRGRFPRDASEVEPQGIAALSRQLNVAVPVDGEAFLTGRTAERLRAEIRARFGFREATNSDAEMLTEWLRDHVAGEADGEIESLIERLETRCRELAIEPPTAWSVSCARRFAHMRNVFMPISTGGCHRRSANVWISYFGPQRATAIVRYRTTCQVVRQRCC
jgi:hypothetical protein